MAGRFGKKAQIIDLIYFFGIVFLVAIIGIIALHVITQVRTQFETDNLIKAENVKYVQDFEDRMPAVIDQLFILTLVGIGIVTLVSSLLIVSHPIFYGIMLIIMAFMTWLGAIYANVYQEFAENPDWSAQADKLTMAAYIMQYYPIVVIVLSVLIVLVMVAKK